MKRKAIAMAMAMMMLASAASVCSAASVTDFKDVPSTSWYYTSVKGAVDDGYMNGVTKDTFAPSNNLTRAMFATILARYDKATVDNTATSAFTDVLPNMWYTGSVVWGNQNGIITGYSATKFGTGDFIKREDLALMVYRYVNFKKYTLKEKTPATFKDADQISAYAKEALEYCRIHGLFIGDQNGYLHPQKFVTRAEAAAVMERIDLIIKDSTGGNNGGGDGGDGSHTSYTYSDYTVTVNTGKNGRTLDLPSIDDASANYIYHVRYADGKYVQAGSDKIDLVTVEKGVCNENNIKRAFNASGIKGLTFTDSIGKTQTIVDENGNICDIPLKYVPIEEVLPSETIESVADQVTASLGYDVTTEDVINLLRHLDNVGIDEEGDLYSERDKEIAAEVARKLNDKTDAELVQKIIDKNPGLEKTMREAGIEKSDLEAVVKKYKDNLSLILGVDSTRSQTAVYASAVTGDDTKGGIAVMVNPVTVAQVQYNKGLDKFVEKYFPENSLTTKDEFKASKNVQDLYAMMSPASTTDTNGELATGWVSGDKASGYTMLTEAQYEAKCEAVIDQIEKIRKEFVVDKNVTSDQLKTALDEILTKLNNRTGINYTVDTEKLSKVLVLSDPNLEDLKNNGITKIEFTKDLTAQEAMDRMNSFLNSAGTSADNDLIKRVANRLSGDYVFTVEITNTSCDKSSAH